MINVSADLVKITQLFFNGLILLSDDNMPPNQKIVISQNLDKIRELLLTLLENTNFQDTS
ncbi:MAG: hypothetical protein COS76_01890 [Candidatus Portnoybacteria bacterium CG06_land_8_20_14_3_00_39_12]|uniref:Uncharacterized protein n=2 Tax=Candidatus Portnoyibacteriota TaxID=1817913 RepID=A0A2M7UHV8_9BACT|nr:MAG: hypothetical protein AUJ33_00630 [Parcubacteria group bacterium CG1_02_40_25]PIU75235.1 MAG: hypothetical protein COS76_01890 [Candidatus Portnoybacteria bacterium CG06_land_8_20_14_3_00_39_12]PIZ70798.1 MAG: hypothetical protein COY09_02090 [Candidatus Portnoybacteria bacterium CG_4_10_14_0_2_um_filter_39_11]